MVSNLSDVNFGLLDPRNSYLFKRKFECSDKKRGQQILHLGIIGYHRWEMFPTL